MKLPTGLHVFERGWLSSNNVFCTTDHHAGLIDTGYATHAPQTLALVQQALQGRTLNDIVNTHLHSDHCGGNALLQTVFPQVHTAIPHLLAEQVQDWKNSEAHYQSVGQQCPAFRFDSVRQPGEVFRLGALDWQALAAPGHDPTSLVFYCAEERLLASADALWEHGFGVIFPELEGQSGFAETRATLEMIAALDVHTVIPGHGRPFTEVNAALDRAFKRINFLTTEPMRNAQNALKVLVKFKLLEQQRMTFADLSQWMAASTVLRHVQQLLTPLFGAQASVAELTQYAIDNLVKVNAAKWEGEVLANHD